MENNWENISKRSLLTIATINIGESLHGMVDGIKEDLSKSDQKKPVEPTFFDKMIENSLNSQVLVDKQVDLKFNIDAIAGDLVKTISSLDKRIEDLGLNNLQKNNAQKPLSNFPVSLKQPIRASLVDSNVNMSDNPSDPKKSDSAFPSYDAGYQNHSPLKPQNGEPKKVNISENRIEIVSSTKSNKIINDTQPEGFNLIDNPPSQNAEHPSTQVAEPMDVESILLNNGNLNGNQNNNNSNVLAEQIQNALQKDNPLKSFLNAEKHTYELISAVKDRTLDLFVLNKGRVTKLKIDEKCFMGDTMGGIKDFPQTNYKYVNLGDSILVTGGSVPQNKSQSKCFLIKVFCNPGITCNIFSYESMAEPRDRHNIIYLSSFNSVVVCSGFYNNSAEINNISTQKWSSLGKLKEMRINATMAFINDRYVYVISGFKLIADKKGSYMNSCEYLDINNKHQGWTLVDYSNLGNVTIAASAMGVISLAKNKIVLLGGWDGTNNLSNFTEVNFQEDSPNIVSVKKDCYPPVKKGVCSNLTSAFVRVEAQAYLFNFSSMSLICYDASINKFSEKDIIN